MPFTPTFPALSLGLPPSPENAPATINIDRTCALFALEVSERRVVKVSESKYEKKRIEKEADREIPRLHRILNLSLSPRSNSSSLTSPDTSTISTNSTLATERIPTPEADKENEAPLSNESPSARSADHGVYSTGCTDGFSGKTYMKKQPGSSQSIAPKAALGVCTNGVEHPSIGKRRRQSTQSSSANVYSPLAPIQRRMPLRDLVAVASTLSAEEKVIRRPVPVPKAVIDDVPHFTDPFNGNVPITAAAAAAPQTYAFSDAPNTFNPFSFPGDDTIGTTRARQWETAAASPPIQLYNNTGVTVATVVSATYGPDEIVELHRRRIYPSSTEPESEWCRGETVVHVRRRDLYPYGKVEPVVTTCNVEIASPRPVGTHRYRDTRCWLEQMSRELEVD